MDWSGVDYCDVFISCLDSFWRHPFTAEHPLLRHWCRHISTNLMKKKTHPNLEHFQWWAHFHFWVKYSIKGNQEQRVMRLTHSVTAHKEQQRSEQMLHSWIHAAHAGRSHWEHGFLEPETLWHTQHAEGAAAQPDDTDTPLLQAVQSILHSRKHKTSSGLIKRPFEQNLNHLASSNPKHECVNNFY